MRYASFFRSVHCGAGELPARCRACRNDRAFRARLAEVWQDLDGPDFECWWETNDEPPPLPEPEFRRPVTIIPPDVQAIETVEEMEAAIKTLPEEVARQGMAKLLRVLQDDAMRTCCGGTKPLAIMRVWLTEHQ